MKLRLFTNAMLVFSALLFVSCDKKVSSSSGGGDSEVEGLFVNEICSNSPDWVELYNANSTDMDISGYRLQDSNGSDEEYTFPEGTTIEAKGYLVIEDELPFGISSSSGDKIVLLDADKNIVDSVTVPALIDGTTYGRTVDGGSTLAVLDYITKGSDNTIDVGQGGTEGFAVSETLLFINEVLSNPVDGEEDFIELYNGESDAIDLEGFILYDGGGVSKGYTFPAGTTIAAGGRLTLTKDVEFTFGISSSGDDIAIIDADGFEYDRVYTPDFTNETVGYTYSRVGDGLAGWQITSATKGTANSAVALNDITGVVINEVYTFSTQETTDDLDWIELYNTTSSSIDISGALLWEAGGSEEAWAFPTGTVIPAKTILLVESDKELLWANTVEYPMWGLSKGPDECIVLANADYSIVDEQYLPSLNRDETWGRITDGSSTFQIFESGTKGTTNTGVARQGINNTYGIWINEVYHDNSDDTDITEWDATVDYIEFYNSTASTIDISGWMLFEDTDEDSVSYTFPEGTEIAAYSFLTFDVYKGNESGPAFGLGVGGDWVFLYTDNKETLVDRVEIPAFSKTSGWRDCGYTYGRITDGVDTTGAIGGLDNVDFAIFTEASRNASNNGKAQLVQ